MGKKASIAVCILVVLSMIVLMVGCNTSTPAETESQSSAASEAPDESVASSESAASSELTNEGPWEVGVAQTAINHPFWVAFIKGLEDEAAKYPINLDIQNGQDDPDTQTKQIETFIAQEKDMIIIVAASINSLVPAAKECNAAGIPVVTINRLLQPVDATDGAEIVTYEGADDFMGGQMQGQAIDELLGGEGNILVVSGNAGASDSEQRTGGLEDYLSNNAPGINILDVGNTDHDNDKTATYMQNMLTRYAAGEIDAIVVQGPYEAIQVAKECQTAERDELLGRIMAFDYPKAVQDAIKDGLLYGTVNQDPMLEGQLGVQIVNMYFTGQQDQIKNPWFIDLPIITAENVDDVPPAWVDES